MCVPTTVLAEEGLRIEPPLPDKVEAADALPLGSVDKAFLRLEDADEVIDVFLPVLYFAVQKRRWAKLHGLSFWHRMRLAGPRASSEPDREVKPIH